MPESTENLALQKWQAFGVCLSFNIGIFVCINLLFRFDKHVMFSYTTLVRWMFNATAVELSTELLDAPASLAAFQVLEDIFHSFSSLKI